MREKEVISMMYGEVLLLFSESAPCWTKELVSMAGEDGDGLEALCRDGLLDRSGETYFLTEKGAAAFRAEARECFFDGAPGERPEDLRRSIFATKLRLLLDGKHLQRWGLKEYLPKAEFLIPELDDKELLSVGEGLQWLWPFHPLVRSMREDFPVTGLPARGKPPLPADTVEKWFRKNGAVPERFIPDLLHLSRYDYKDYEDFTSPPGDTWRLLNADRFFCMEAPVTGEDAPYLRAVGRFHLVLEVCRRMILPGYMDKDSHDQDGINWMLFVFDRDEEAASLAKRLASYGEALTGPVLPAEVWTLSFEALSAFPGKAENIHDLLPAVGHGAARMA